MAAALLMLNGSVGAIAALIDHRDDRGLHHSIAKHNEYSSWEAKRFEWLASQGKDGFAGWRFAGFKRRYFHDIRVQILGSRQRRCRAEWAS